MNYPNIPHPTVERFSTSFQGVFGGGPPNLADVQSNSDGFIANDYLHVYGNMYSLTGEAVWLDKYAIPAIDHYFSVTDAARASRGELDTSANPYWTGTIDVVRNLGSSYAHPGWQHPDDFEPLGQRRPVVEVLTDGQYLQGIMYLIDIATAKGSLTDAHRNKFAGYVAKCFQICSSWDETFRTNVGEVSSTFGNGITIAGNYWKVNPGESTYPAGQLNGSHFFRPVPYNHAAGMLSAALLMHKYQLGLDGIGFPAYLTRAQQFKDYLCGPERRLVTGSSNQYYWPYSTDASGVSDIDHTKIDAEFLLTCYDNGFTDVTREDLTFALNTMRERCFMGTVAQPGLLPEGFHKGINLGWVHYARDFGGFSIDGTQSVSENSAPMNAAFADLAAHDIAVVRLWMFAELWTDRINYDGSGAITGVDPIILADVDKVLELAATHGLKLELTIFSFDAWTTEKDYHPTQRNLADYCRDATLRTSLMENLIRPIAERVQASQHRSSLFGWDLCNEPDWIITSQNLNDPNVPFEPHNQSFHQNPPENPNADPVSHSQIKAFFNAMMAVLRTETPGFPITIGQASVKWKSAFTDLPIDYYEFHFYEWMQPFFPFDTDPPFTDKPVMIGEFPITNLSSGETVTEMLRAYRDRGYLGALAWDYNHSVNGVEQADVDAVLDLIDGFDDSIGGWSDPNPVTGVALWNDLMDGSSTSSHSSWQPPIPGALQRNDQTAGIHAWVLFPNGATLFDQAAANLEFLRNYPGGISPGNSKVWRASTDFLLATTPSFKVSVDPVFYGDVVEGDITIDAVSPLTVQYTETGGQVTEIDLANVFTARQFNPPKIKAVFGNASAEIVDKKLRVTYPAGTPRGAETIVVLED